MTSVASLPRDQARRLFHLLVGVFFIGGFLTSVVGLLVPRLKLTLGLDYTQALLVQFAFHGSYLVFAAPITAAIVRVGYARAIAAGLGVMTLGCVALVGAQLARDFALILAALLLLSLGQTVLQIAANAVATFATSSTRSAVRLTLLQGFNSIGTVVGPLLAAPVLLTPGGRGAIATLPFVGTATVLAALTVAFVMARHIATGATAADTLNWGRLAAAWRDRRLRAGVAAMFAYVGAEVTIGTLLANFLMGRDVIAARPATAGLLVSLYWAGAMIGRFAGAGLLRRVSPARLLGVAACGAAALTVVAPSIGGSFGAAALLGVGLCNSVMYPAIFALALPADRDAIPIGSMLLCMAVVGGAIVPVATGVAADAFGLGMALLLPAVCYVAILAFARRCAAEQV